MLFPQIIQDRFTFIIIPRYHNRRGFARKRPEQRAHFEDPRTSVAVTGSDSPASLLPRGGGRVVFKSYRRLAEVFSAPLVDGLVPDTSARCSSVPEEEGEGMFIRLTPRLICLHVHVFFLEILEQ